MPALCIGTDLSPEELRSLAKAERDARVARRMLAIANALSGMSREAATPSSTPPAALGSASSASKGASPRSAHIHASLKSMLRLGGIIFYPGPQASCDVAAAAEHLGERTRAVADAAPCGCALDREPTTHESRAHKSHHLANELDCRVSERE